MLWLLIPAAFGCPELPAQVDAAWAAFDDAELVHAKDLLDVADDSLGCQAQVVDNAELLGLYRLHALVALAHDDREGAVFWTLRAVGANPEAGPPADLGPELAELYATWSSRLSSVQVTVTVEGGGTVFVDGRTVTEWAPLAVIEGPHLVQVQGLSLSSEVVALSEDRSFVTDLPSTDPPAGWVPPPELAPSPSPVPVPVVRRRHPAGLWGTGMVIGLLGGAGLTLAAITEQRFKADPFDANSYGNCPRGEGCYREARQQEIVGQAKQVRLLYGGGYGLLGLGSALTLTGMIGLPTSAPGASLALRW